MFLNEWNYRLAIIFGNIFCFVLYFFWLNNWGMGLVMMDNDFYWFRLFFCWGFNFYLVDLMRNILFTVFFLRNSLIFADGPVVVKVVKGVLSESCSCKSIHDGKGLVLDKMLPIDVEDWFDENWSRFSGYVLQNASEKVWSAVIGSDFLRVIMILGATKQAIWFYEAH